MRTATHPAAHPAKGKVASSKPAITAAELPVGFRTKADVANANVIAGVARSLGVNQRTAIATAINESGLNARSVGDQGSSFGLFQLHRGGELGALTPAQAFNPATNARVALSQFRSVQTSRPALARNPGALAATAQRPLSPGAYATAVNADYAQLGKVPTGVRTGGKPPTGLGAIGQNLANVIPNVAHVGGALASVPGKVASVPGKVAKGAATAAGYTAGTVAAATVTAGTSAAVAGWQGILDSSLKPWAKSHFFELVTGAILAGLLLGKPSTKGLTLNLPSSGAASQSAAPSSSASPDTSQDSPTPAEEPSPAPPPDPTPADTVAALRTMGYTAPQAKGAVNATYSPGMSTGDATTAALQALDRGSPSPKAPRARREPVPPPGEEHRPAAEPVGMGPEPLPEDLGPPRVSRETRRSSRRRRDAQQLGADEQRALDAAERARYRAEEATELRRAVLQHGGIRTSSVSRDYDAGDLPFYLRRRGGQPLDDLADQLGYESPDHLVAALNGHDAPMRVTRRNAA